MEGRSYEEKKALLDSENIDFDSLPDWQKKGVGIYWGEVEKTGFDPIKKEEVKVKRRKIIENYNLPSGKEYEKMISEFMK